MRIVNPKKETATVKKGQALVTARYELSELALKILTVTIASLRADDDELQRYSLKVSDFKELTGLSGKSIYENLDRATNDLMKRPLKIDKEHGGFLKMFWFSSCEYIARDGTLEMLIDPKMKPYLLELQSRFLQYDLRNILPLKSAYVIRLYELLKDHYNQAKRYGKRPELEISIAELREMFAIPESYRYNNIKDRILDNAQKQLKAHTDITFEYRERKTARRVTELIFTIKQNQRDEIPQSFKALIRKCRGMSAIEYRFDPDQAPALVSINEQGYFDSPDIKMDKHHSEYLTFQMFRHREYWENRMKAYIEWLEGKATENPKQAALF